jgi:hypothetical protein
MCLTKFLTCFFFPKNYNGVLKLPLLRNTPKNATKSQLKKEKRKKKEEEGRASEEGTLLPPI